MYFSKSPNFSYKWIIMLEKCGHPDLNVFHLKWQFKRLNSWGPFWSYKLNSTANLTNLADYSFGSAFLNYYPFYVLLGRKCLKEGPFLSRARKSTWVSTQRSQKFSEFPCAKTELSGSKIQSQSHQITWNCPNLPIKFCWTNHSFWKWWLIECIVLSGIILHIKLCLLFGFIW